MTCKSTKYSLSKTKIPSWWKKTLNIRNDTSKRITKVCELLDMCPNNTKRIPSIENKLVNENSFSLILRDLKYSTSFVTYITSLWISGWVRSLVLVNSLRISIMSWIIITKFKIIWDIKIEIITDFSLNIVNEFERISLRERIW